MDEQADGASDSESTAASDDSGAYWRFCGRAMCLSVPSFRVCLRQAETGLLVHSSSGVVQWNEDGMDVPSVNFKEMLTKWTESISKAQCLKSFQNPKGQLELA